MYLTKEVFWQQLSYLLKFQTSSGGECVYMYTCTSIPLLSQSGKLHNGQRNHQQIRTFVKEWDSKCFISLPYIECCLRHLNKGLLTSRGSITIETCPRYIYYIYCWESEVFSRESYMTYIFCIFCSLMLHNLHRNLMVGVPSLITWSAY